MDTHLHTFGRTTWEMSMRLPREREANKTTPWCLFCSALGNIGPLNRSVECCVQERKSWRTLTMSTWYALLPGSEQSHRSWKRNCSVTPTSASITGKPKCGTVVERNPARSWNSRARLVDPTAVVWKSDPRLPPNERGSPVLGCTNLSPEYVAARLNAKSEEQRSLFQRIPLVADLQAAWVLLFNCGATRANLWLRNVQPAQTSVCPTARRQRVGLFFPTHWVVARVAGGQVDFVRVTSVDVLCFSNLAAPAPYAHMPRTQKRAQITTCTVVCCDSDLGAVCDGPLISQHEIARDTKARITAKMKLESSLLHICPKRIHERPTSIGALPVDQCTLIGSEES